MADLELHRKVRTLELENSRQNEEIVTRKTGIDDLKTEIDDLKTKNRELHSKVDEMRSSIEFLVKKIQRTGTEKFWNVHNEGKHSPRNTH